MFMKLHHSLFLVPCSLFIFISCSVSQQISKKAENTLLKDPAVSTGFIGISIYEPATGKYWYNYNATKNFIPASNTKLFSLYAGMKYLGDSLVGLRYQNISDSEINISPTGDPSFLHSDFKNQPILDFLKGIKKKINFSYSWNENALGYGWAWDDYNDDYMAERSSFPVYGNTLKLNYESFQYSKNYLKIKWKTSPAFFTDYIDSIYTIPLNRRNLDSATASKMSIKFYGKRNWENNKIRLLPAVSDFSTQEIPFHTGNIFTAIEILNKEFSIDIQQVRIEDLNIKLFPSEKIHVIHSQPTDSLFKPMMHRSDNFFAEQTLLMVSNERLGYMNDGAIIDTLLATDLKDVPQRPKWVDGSGLSRYNLFTPQAFIYILNKMRNEFGLSRLKTILPTGGEGTLKSYYKKDSSFIYAKTGTLSNNCALSGFLTTNSGKLLIFSILANHYQTGATPIRKAVERFLTGIREKY